MVVSYVDPIPFWRPCDVAHSTLMALLTLQLLPQRLQSPTDACLNRTQWGMQAGSDFLMTKSLKKGQEEGVSLLSRQPCQGVTHGLTLGSICQRQRCRQRLQGLLREHRFVGEASTITP